MEIISVRAQPDYAAAAIAFLQQAWGSGNNEIMYEDCIRHCLDSPSPLPQWYLLRDGETLTGCAGLIPNDFISRMDLWPWICALYVAREYRGHGYDRRLLDYARADARRLGFRKIYLSTEHVGYYERYGFVYLGQGWHPWGESSRIYAAPL